MTSQVSIEYEQNNVLDLNVYEIRINDNYINNKAYIDSFLFDCQCALFLVDITNPESFELIKRLFSNIEIKTHPYLKMILVQNKIEQESNRKISNIEFKEYLNYNKLIDTIEISVKNGNNIQELIKKINIIINESNNELPINIVSESQNKIKSLINESDRLNFNLMGDAESGREDFFNTYFKTELKSNLSSIGIDRGDKYIN